MDTKNLLIRKLNRIEVALIYLRHMTKDFPRNERKPLFIIFRGIRAGYYECYGFFEGEHLAGYMFLVRSGNDYLIDYFAVVRNRRDQGVGSAIMQSVQQSFDANGLILEVEDPQYAKDEEEKAVRERRISFYMRNGFVDTGVRAVTFGVEFIILSDRNHLYETVRVKELYRSYYIFALGEKMFENNITIM